ncbi:ABC transporter ATP-binding protein [Paenibacillaceae bacterium T2]|uniref:ABC transporter ATP-binding protein n=1 Tax=Ferviditalea candida TaxID=3108399 RepID=A0ABU5ZIQ3_9BACL|nr:ABC transporter ATP-binding protein [Paenibacillaceae bacterium T2]
MSLLEVTNLQTYFHTPNGVVKAVNGVQFSMEPGEIMALVGESGSGKSITGLSIMGLVPKPNGRIVDGQIRFEGRDLASMKEKELRKIRGQDIAMIFQNPLTAMDPSFKIGNQMGEIICYRQGVSAKTAWQESEKLLDLVGIHDPKRVLDSYPHALSGGMRQRVMIAMALSCQPKLLIADEPTTALDATIQKQILMLLKKINKEFKTSILMITHDFGVVASLCDTVAVMYAGKIVEYGRTSRILSDPEHPYTRGLIGAMPENGTGNKERRRLTQIDGFPPDLMRLPQGCSFYERCWEAQKKCAEQEPGVTHFDEQHVVRCLNREEESYAVLNRS